MVLTADTTWRWSRVPRLLGRPDTLYARFWSQAVRWLAGRSLDDDRPLLAVSTDSPSYDMGKRVTVTVRRQPRPGVDLAGTEPAAEVRDPAGRALPLALKGDSAEPDKMTAEFFPSVSGRYEVAAALTRGTKPIANQASEFLVHGSDLELADPGTNPGNLQALAKMSGGKYFDITEVDSLPKEIDRKERRETLVQKKELWNSPFLFLFFLAAVTAEWCIRRRNHLV